MRRAARSVQSAIVLMAGLAVTADGPDKPGADVPKLDGVWRVTSLPRRDRGGRHVARVGGSARAAGSHGGDFVARALQFSMVSRKVTPPSICKATRTLPP